MSMNPVHDGFRRPRRRTLTDLTVHRATAALVVDRVSNDRPRPASSPLVDAADTPIVVMKHLDLNPRRWVAADGDTAQRARLAVDEEEEVAVNERGSGGRMMYAEDAAMCVGDDCSVRVVGRHQGGADVGVSVGQ